MGIVHSENRNTHPTGQDRKLPGLAMALQAIAMTPRLRTLLQAEGAMSVTLLKHVPGKRAVLRYRFADGSSAIGKMMRKDRAEGSRAIHAALSQALVGRTRTPRPLAYWEDLGLLVQEDMPGEPLPHWSTLSQVERGVERMAESLADLHGLRTGAGSPATLADHIRRTCHPGLEALRTAVPHLGAPLRRLEADLFASEERLPLDLVPSHGDYGPGQILMTPDQVSLLDLDGFSHSDAALDVANTLVGLQVHAGLEARALQQRFLETYLHERRLSDLAGLPHYLAFAHLRRGMILLRRRPAGWEEQVQDLVGRARQCL